MSIYAHHIRAIQQEADDTLKKLGDGKFSDIAQAKGLSEYRKGLLRALEILRQPVKATQGDV